MKFNTLLFILACLSTLIVFTLVSFMGIPVGLVIVIYGTVISVLLKKILDVLIEIKNK